MPLCLALGAQPGKPSAVPCAFLGTEEGNHIDLHGIKALTAMSPDTHPTHCLGPPWRGPDVISQQPDLAVSTTCLQVRDGCVALNPETTSGT